MSEVVEFARELVRTRSTSDVGEAEAAALVADRMRSFGWDPVVEEVAPGRPNVVAVLDGGGGPGKTLLFEGHTDVVTEGRSEDWSFPPYAGDIVDGRLRGRGAADMKGGLAAAIYAAREVQRQGPFPGRLVVAALVDEEGLMLGAKAFSRGALASEVDGAIIAEPEAGEICPVAKGALRLRIDLHGTMAHGAMPDQGANPIGAISGLLASIAGYQDELQAVHPAHPDLGPVFVTPTVLQAGEIPQLNVIPALASVGLDIRTIPGVDHEHVLKRIAELAAQAVELPDFRNPAGLRVSSKVSVIDDRPAVDTPVDDPVVTALAAAHREESGQPARFGGVPGATDGTILTRDAGIPTVVYGPGGKWIAHQRDEDVEVADIEFCCRVYTGAALRFLGVGVTSEGGEPG